MCINKFACMQAAICIEDTHIPYMCQPYRKDIIIVYMYIPLKGNHIVLYYSQYKIIYNEYIVRVSTEERIKSVTLSKGCCTCYCQTFSAGHCNKTKGAVMAL